MRFNSYLLTMLSGTGEGAIICSRGKELPVLQMGEMVASSVGTLQINANAETQMIRKKENRRVELKKRGRMLAVKFCQGGVIGILLDCWLVEWRA